MNAKRITVKHNREGYCETCKFGPTPCDRRLETNAQPQFRDLLGEYTTCPEWVAGDERVVSIEAA